MTTAHRSSPAPGRALSRSFPSRRRWLLHLPLLAGGFCMLYPLLWMIGSSFKPDSQIFTELSPIPRGLDFTNYARGWTLGTGTTFTTFYVNSFIVCAGAIVGNLLSCSLAAYAFARLRFRFKRF